MLEQLKGYGMTAVEPDQAASREVMKPVYEKYDAIWTKELREKSQVARPSAGIGSCRISRPSASAYARRVGVT